MGASFLHLPRHIRDRIYGYLNITDKVVDLNWRRIEVRNDPQRSDAEHLDWACWNGELYISCYHAGWASCIARREDSVTYARYWEDVEDFECQEGCYSDRCEEENCSFWDGDFATMLSSWQVFTDMYRWVYGKNRFVIDRAGPAGFNPLIKLRGYSLRALTHLTIRLDGEVPEKINMSHHWSRTSQLLPMKHYSRYGKQAYKEWSALIARLAESSLVPGRLNLFLVAKVPDVKEAKLVLDPLHSLPTLKSCGIWLNNKPIPEINALIKETIDVLITPDPDDHDDDEEVVQPFPYLELPQEIRLRILEFSDLITSADLEWRPDIDMIDPVPLYYCSCYSEVDYSSYEGLIHFEDCHTEYMRYPEARFIGLDFEPDPDRPSHCCCCYSNVGRRLECRAANDPYMCIFGCSEHSAYLATKVVPDKWKPFCHSLLLVSRQVRQDALPVFFKKSRFVITPVNALPLRHFKSKRSRFQYHDRITMSRIALSFFLSAMAKEALRHIRHIEWFVLPFRTGTDKAKAIYLDQLDTMEFMVQAMTLSNLTLVINMRHLHEEIPYDEDFSYSVRLKDDTKFYEQILRPLCLLGENGLKDCWVYLCNIWKPNPDYHSKRWHHKFNRDNDEMKWEKRIMGDKTYNAFKRGKPWTERIERRVEGPSRDVGIYAQYREIYPLS